MHIVYCYIYIYYIMLANTIMYMNKIIVQLNLLLFIHT